MNLVYEIALHFFGLAMLPKLGWSMLVKNKNKKSFSLKWGKDFPKISQKKGPTIWLHGVSLGETKALASIIFKLREAFPEAFLLLSSGTETGHEEAKKNKYVDDCVFLPFDFSYVIAPIVRQVKPDLVIISENDLWYNFLSEAKKCGAKIAIINGKISERSFYRFSKIPFFSKRLFGLLDHLCVQGDKYQERFLNLGISAHKISVTGNLKLSAIQNSLGPEEKEEWKKKLGIQNNDFVFTWGSTHDPEEEILLETLSSRWQRIPNLKVLLVPRHPERFDKVARLLASKGIAFSMLSNNPTPDSQVILIDAMGKLNLCYAISDLAFVGGTLQPKVGGHNMIEPCFFGVPVLCGPHLWSQPDLWRLVAQYEAGKLFSEKALDELLELSSERKRLGQNGLQLIHDLAGVLEKTFNPISMLLKKSIDEKGSI